jgi:uncharacterized protein (TIRG00374 family)
MTKAGVLPRIAGSKRVRLALGIGLSVAATAIAVAAVDISRTAAVMARLDPRWLLPPLAILVVQFVVRAARWSLLLRAIAGRPVPFRTIVTPLLVGYLGNVALPGRAGEVARTVLVSRRERLPIASVGATVLVERIIDLTALLALGLVVLGSRLPSGAAGAMLALPAAMVALLLGARHGHQLVEEVAARTTHRRLVGAVTATVSQFAHAVRALPIRSLLVAAAVSTLAWAADAAVWWFAARSIGIELAPHIAIALSLGAVLGTALPAAPGYLGTYELAALGAAAAVGVDPTVALPIVLIAHVVAVVPISIAGAVAILRVGSAGDSQTRRAAARSSRSPAA